MQKIIATLKQIPTSFNSTKIEDQQYNHLLNKIHTLQALDVGIRFINESQTKDIITQRLDHQTLFQKLIKTQQKNLIIEKEYEDQCESNSISLQRSSPRISEQQNTEICLKAKKGLEKKHFGRKSKIIHLSIENQRLQLEERILKEKIKCQKLLCIKNRQNSYQIKQSKKNLLKLKEIVQKQIDIDREIQEIQEDYEHLKTFQKQQKCIYQRMQYLSLLLETNSHLPPNQLIHKLQNLIQKQA